MIFFKYSEKVPDIKDDAVAQAFRIFAGPKGWNIEGRACSTRQKVPQPSSWVSVKGQSRERIHFRLASSLCQRATQERIDMAVFPALQGGPHNHQTPGSGVKVCSLESEPSQSLGCEYQLGPQLNLGIDAHLQLLRGFPNS